MIFYGWLDMLIKSNERSEDSYICLADFFCSFLGKKFKIFIQLGIMLFLCSIKVHLLKVK